MEIINQIKKSFTKKDVGITKEAVLAALSKVQDPDLNKDIVSLGFITNCEIKGNVVHVTVNLTTPACPAKDLLKRQCEARILEIPGVAETHVTMTAQTRSNAAPRQPAVAAALGQVKNIIAVASGKGGVGKSTTTVNLAYALAETGAKVGVLDADVYGPSIAMMMKPELMKPKAGQAEMKNNMISPAMADGIKVISLGMFSQGDKAAILRGPMAANVIRQFLTQVDWGELDYLLIDYPPGTGDIQLTLSQTAPITGGIIVTTPQNVALLDVRKAVTMFNTLKVPVLGVIETMSYFICDNCDKKHRLFRQHGGEKIAQEMGVPLLGAIPIEEAVVVGGDEGLPVVKDNKDTLSAQAYTEAAKQAAAQISILNNGKQGLTDFEITWQ